MISTTILSSMPWRKELAVLTSALTLELELLLLLEQCGTIQYAASLARINISNRTISHRQFFHIINLQKYCDNSDYTGLRRRLSRCLDICSKYDVDQEVTCTMYAVSALLLASFFLPSIQAVRVLKNPSAEQIPTCLSRGQRSVEAVAFLKSSDP
ncbi:hypothetical protein K438DRAFT_1762447 [Mycena galopus ATCC 62051]|nr:hypothetical protein K438DRAFT_1762447 [Mycena galopus ATCC 62051]